MKKLFFSALVFAALTSCSKEIKEVFYETDFSTVEATFTPSVVARVSTADEWEDTDQIGVYMAQSGSDLFSNIAFTYDSGVFTGASSLYYPNSGDDVSFYAYYPYQTSTSKLRDIDITEQKPFLMAETSAEFNKNTGGSVALKFGHKLSYVNFIFVGGGGLEEYTDAAALGVSEVTVTGLTTEAQYSLTTKAFVASSYQNVGATLTLSAASDGNYGMYILPTSHDGTDNLYSLEGAELNVKTTYGDFSASLAGYTINSNTESDCTVKVNFTEIEDIDGNIVSWEYKQTDVSLEFAY